MARLYPSRPVVGVGAVILCDRSVVLVRRRFEPLAGRWSIPGGAVELGESPPEAIVREVREETNLEVEVDALAGVINRVERDADGRVRYHYVLLDYACRLVGGSPVASSDAGAVAVAPLDRLETFELSPDTLELIARVAAIGPA